MCTCAICKTIETRGHRASLDQHPTIQEFVREFLTPLNGSDGTWMVRGVQEGRTEPEVVFERIEKAWIM